MSTYELSGSVSDKEKGFIETWENVGQSTNYVVRENRRGDEEYVLVSGPKKFKLSTYDRMLTEDKISQLRLNPFRNGCFRPIIVPDDINIESNPNALSDDDIVRVFNSSETAWDEYMKIIDSPGTLQRMIDIAESGEGDLVLRRFQQLQDLHSKFSNLGKRVVSSADPEIQKEMDNMGGSTVEPGRRPGRPRATRP